MLSESFVTSIRAQPKSANTAIAKDVGIYIHEIHPSHTIKSSFKKSSAPVNALAANSTHIFAAQVDKAVVHVYSRECGNQEALVSFPERIRCLNLAGDGVLVIGTVEGRIIFMGGTTSPLLVCWRYFDNITGLYRSNDLNTCCSSPSSDLHCSNEFGLTDRLRRLEHTSVVTTPAPS